MRTLTLFLSIICGSLISLFAQSPIGSWEGKLDLGTIDLRIVFHITNTNGTWDCKMDSPDQNAYGLITDKVTFENDTLTIVSQQLRMTYTGNLIEEKLVGTFSQMGKNLPLTLTRTSQKSENLRPQEPQPPYPYMTQEVFFINKNANNIKLAGTLTMPRKKGPHPAVILVSGSGPQNRNEELMGHKPFAVIADFLTRKGIAVLRYDDRGCFESQGDFAKATTKDFADDALAAIKFLQKLPDINPSKIGIIGHSEGGVVAPMVAAQDSSVAFIVLMAGMGVEGKELLKKQSKEINLKKQANNPNITKLIESNNQIIEYAYKHKTFDTKEFEKIIEDSYTSMGIQKNELKAVKAQVIQQFSSVWMQEFLHTNPAEYLKLVRCPVLAINGTFDLQVDADENLTAIEQALKEGHNPLCTIKFYPKLNHLFQECETGLPFEYGKIKQTIAPIILEDIASWILKVGTIN